MLVTLNVFLSPNLSRNFPYDPCVKFWKQRIQDNFKEIKQSSNILGYVNDNFAIFLVGSTF